MCVQYLLAVEIGQVEAAADGEAMTDRQTDGLDLTTDRLNPQTCLIERTAEKADIGPAVAQRRLLLPPAHRQQSDLDLGMPDPENSDRLGNVQAGGKRDHQTLHPAVDFEHPSDRGIDTAEKTGGLVPQLLPGRGQLNTPGTPDEEGAAQFAFQRADLAAQDRLGDEQLLRGPAEVPLIGDGGKIAELAQVQIHAIRVSIGRKRYWISTGFPRTVSSMILITAPTGDIGSQVLNGLIGRLGVDDEALRVIVRDPAKLSAATRDRVEVVQGSHGDADVVGRALAGVNAVFWLVPPNPATPSLHAAYSDFTRPAAAAFVEHGVTHVVGVSALGRGTPVAERAGLVTASLAMDDLIARSGVAYRALANSSFMDNLLRQVTLIRDQGMFTDTVAADRQAPAAATRDIAAAATTLLLDRSWTGSGEIAVLGPENLSANDMAATMSDVLGQPVRYQRESLDDFGATLASYGMGEAMAQGMVDMMRAKDDGLDDGVARTPETASRTSFRQWCEEVLKPAIGQAA